MASKRIQKVCRALDDTHVKVNWLLKRTLLTPYVQELKDLQKDPPTSCSAGHLCHLAVPICITDCGTCVRYASCVYAGPNSPDDLFHWQATIMG